MIQVKARITYLGDIDDDSYVVNCAEDCKDKTDKVAYRLLCDMQEKCIKVGKTIVERI